MKASVKKMYRPEEKKKRSQNAGKNQALFWQMEKAAPSTKPKHLASNCQNR